jgi:hypothetical protein
MIITAQQLQTNTVTHKRIGSDWTVASHGQHGSNKADHRKLLRKSAADRGKDKALASAMRQGDTPVALSDAIVDSLLSKDVLPPVIDGLPLD